MSLYDIIGRIRNVIGFPSNKKRRSIDPPEHTEATAAKQRRVQNNCYAMDVAGPNSATEYEDHFPSLNEAHRSGHSFSRKIQSKLSSMALRRQSVSGNNDKTVRVLDVEDNDPAQDPVIMSVAPRESRNTMYGDTFASASDSKIPALLRTPRFSRLPPVPGLMPISNEINRSSTRPRQTLSMMNRDLSLRRSVFNDTLSTGSLYSNPNVQTAHQMHGISNQTLDRNSLNYDKYKELLEKVNIKESYGSGILAKKKDIAPELSIIDLCEVSTAEETNAQDRRLASLNMSATTTNDDEPKLPPINSIHSKLEAKPEWALKHMEELTMRYSRIKIEREDQIQNANETALEHQAATRQREKLFQKRLISHWLVPDTPIVLLDDVDEPEPEPYNDFPTFTADQRAFIEHKMRPHPDQEQLITKFSITIRRVDIQTLSGLNWLNDEIINFYMNLLTERSQLKPKDYPKVYAFSTFFLSRLSASGHSGVRRWTRKVDVFAYDIIPVPVHVGGVHWCMAIIDFRYKTIRYYDSMLSPNPNVLAMLADYLVEESRDKKGQPYDMTGWSTESMTNIPRQNNQSDCGVFSCAFAETIARNRPILFSQQHMPYIRMKMVLEICKGELIH